MPKKSKSLKILFAGTPSLCLPTLKKINDEFDIVGIVTQPDRKSGRRGLKLSETPVATYAKENNIKLFKTEKISSIRNQLEDLGHEILLTFSFGQYIPTYILNLGKYPPVNIHGSLLPKYRGASPVQAAILNGDSKIGITLIKMVKAMDAGEMYFKAEKTINETTSSDDAFEIVSKLASSNINNWLKKIIENDYKSEIQGDKWTSTYKLEKADGEIKSNMNFDQARRIVNGYNSNPGAFSFIEGKRVKIFKIIMGNVKQAPTIKLSDADASLIDYQFEGKKRIKLSNNFFDNRRVIG